MERQTLQQQTPVYHVCQACGGDGCAACSTCASWTVISSLTLSGMMTFRL